MGVVDAQLILVENQGAITADAATTDLIDLGVADPNKGVGRPAYMRFTVTTTGTGTGTVAFVIQGCDTEGGTYVAIQSSEAYVSTTLTAGRVILVPMPQIHERFVKGYFEITGTVGALIVTVDITAG